MSNRMDINWSIELHLYSRKGACFKSVGTKDECGRQCKFANGNQHSYKLADKDKTKKKIKQRKR